MFEKSGLSFILLSLEQKDSAELHINWLISNSSQDATKYTSIYRLKCRIIFERQEKNEKSIFRSSPI